MMTRLSTLRRHAGLFCLGLVVFTGVSLARADDAPKFSDPDVTAYAKSYGEFTDSYSTNMKAYMATVKSGDTAKMQEAAKKMQDDAAKAGEMSTKGATISGKVKPDETQKFSEYLQKCSQKMADAAKQ